VQQIKQSTIIIYIHNTDGGGDKKYKCKKLQFIHKLTASDTSKTAKKSQKGDITHQHIA